MPGPNDWTGKPGGTGPGPRPVLVPQPQLQLPTVGTDHGQEWTTFGTDQLSRFGPEQPNDNTTAKQEDLEELQRQLDEANQAIERHTRTANRVKYRMAKFHACNREGQEKSRELLSSSISQTNAQSGATVPGSNGNGRRTQKLPIAIQMEENLHRSVAPADKSFSNKEVLGTGRNPHTSQTQGPQHFQAVASAQATEQWLHSQASVVQQAYGRDPTGFPIHQPNALSQNYAAQPVENTLNPYNNPTLPGYVLNTHPNFVPVQTRQHTQTPYEATANTGKRRRNDSSSPDYTSSEHNGVCEEGTTRETKRQKRLKEYAARGIEIGNNGSRVGETRTNEFTLELEYKLSGNWVLAAYHSDRRAKLLRIQNAKGQYMFPQCRGPDEDDQTAFHEAHANIDMSNRAVRPAILYQWDPPKKPNEYIHPGYMYDEDDHKLLLDVNSHPIKDWPELPKVISGQIDGLWLEYFSRLNPNIQAKDMIARFPAKTQKNETTANRARKPQAYGNKRMLARIMCGTRAWQAKEGSPQIAAELRRLMPQRVLDERRLYGTTKSWRDLSPVEVEAIRLVNRGKGSATKRAGNKELSAEARNQAAQKKDPKLLAALQGLEREKAEDDDQYRRIGAPDTAATEQHQIGQPPQVYSQYFDSDDTSIEELTNGANVSQVSEGGQTSLQDHSDPNAQNHSNGYGENVQASETPGMPAPGFQCMKPVTTEQMHSIDRSLDITRADYRNWSNRQPPETTIHACYQVQYSDLQNSIETLWRNTKPGQAPPRLYMRAEWYGDWNGWMLQDGRPALGGGSNLGAATENQGSAPLMGSGSGAEVMGNRNMYGDPPENFDPAEQDLLFDISSWDSLDWEHYENSQGQGDGI
ncbi:MAG: hypothetical protein Q9186_001271 [Xanthomendoza sp. 1 TL-2023]